MLLISEKRYLQCFFFCRGTHRNAPKKRVPVKPYKKTHSMCPLLGGASYASTFCIKSGHEITGFANGDLLKLRKNCWLSQWNRNWASFLTCFTVVGVENRVKLVEPDKLYTISIARIYSNCKHEETQIHRCHRLTQIVAPFMSFALFAIKRFYSRNAASIMLDCS